MNPVFVFLVILAAVIVWFLCAFLFKPLGRFIYRIGKDAADNMTEGNEVEEKEKDE